MAAVLSAMLLPSRATVAENGDDTEYHVGKPDDTDESGAQHNHNRRKRGAHRAHRDNGQSANDE